MYNEVRQAAEVHRQVRKYVTAEVAKPGVPMTELCERLEAASRALRRRELDRWAFCGLPE